MGSKQEWLGFMEDPEEETEPCVNRRCTPEDLLEFIQRTVASTGRQPTLLDCKQEFGGILAPMISFWELKRRGLA